MDYNFPGFSIGRCHCKLLIKLSKVASQRFPEWLRTRCPHTAAATAAAVFAKISPNITGLLGHYRGVVSARIFASPRQSSVDALLQVGELVGIPPLAWARGR